MRTFVRYGFPIWVVIALLLVFVDRTTTYSGRGSTDVTVEFRVTDAEGGEPIEGVTLVVHTAGKQEIELTTNPDGSVAYQDTAVLYTDTSGLGWTSRRFVAAPRAYVFVKPTSRYVVPDEPIDLSAPGGSYSGKVVRIGPRQAKFVVPISLRKSTP